MKPKNIVTVGLLLFVGTSLVVLAIKGGRRSPPALQTGEPMISDGVLVYYFHGKTRCATCNTIEAYTRQVVESNFAGRLEAGLLQWRVVNYQLPANEHFKKKYELIASSVVLVRIKDGNQEQWQNLYQIWGLVGDKDEFFKYVRSEIAGYLEKQ